MKQKPNKLTKLAVLIFSISLMVWNCEKEDEIFVEKKQETSTQNTLYAKDVPHIIDYLKKETNGSLKIKVENKKITKSTEIQSGAKLERTPLGYIDTNLALQLKNDVTNTNKYTFEVIDNDLGTFINLIIIEESQNSIKSYFIKYIPTEAWLNTKVSDLKNFSGSIEIYSYSGNLINTYTLNSGLVLGMSSKQSPCADGITYQNGGSDSGNQNGDPNNGSGSSGSGYIPVEEGVTGTGYWPWSPWVYVPFGNGGFGGGGSGTSEEIAENEDEGNGSQAGHCPGPSGNGDCYCHLLKNIMAQIDLQINTGLQGEDNEGEDGDEDCINVGVLISPIYLLDLTPEQTDWLTHEDNFEIYQSVSNFLIENPSQEEQEFAVLAVEASVDGGDVDFEDKVILDSTFTNSITKCIHDKMKSNANNIYSKMLNHFNSSTQKNIKFSINNSISTQIGE